MHPFKMLYNCCLHFFRLFLFAFKFISETFVYIYLTSKLVSTYNFARISRIRWVVANWVTQKFVQFKQKNCSTLYKLSHHFHPFIHPAMHLSLPYPSVHPFFLQPSIEPSTFSIHPLPHIVFIGEAWIRRSTLTNTIPCLLCRYVSLPHSGFHPKRLFNFPSSLGGLRCSDFLS